MENLQICLRAVLPLFLIMGVGYAAKSLHAIDRNDVPKLNKLAFRYFMPVMLFYNLYTSDLQHAIQTSSLLYTLMGGDAELAGNIVVLTNALCPFTMFLWAFLFKTLGMF